MIHLANLVRMTMGKYMDDTLKELILSLYNSKEIFHGGLTLQFHTYIPSLRFHSISNFGADLEILVLSLLRSDFLPLYIESIVLNA